MGLWRGGIGVLVACLGAHCGCGRGPIDPVRELPTPAVVAGEEPRTGEAVIGAYNELREASLSNKGAVAAGRVAKATLDYYSQIRDLALFADRQALRQRALVWQLTALGMRIRIPADQLEAMDGRALYVHAVNNGWIGKNSMADEGVSGIVVTGDHARGAATKGGQPVGLDYHFLREEGAWRLDMMQLMKHAHIGFDRAREQSGLSEDEFLARTLEAMTGHRLGDATWVPPRPRAAGSGASGE